MSHQLLNPIIASSMLGSGTGLLVLSLTTYHNMSGWTIDSVFQSGLLMGMLVAFLFSFGTALLVKHHHDKKGGSSR